MSYLNIAFDRYASIGTVMHYILIISLRVNVLDPGWRITFAKRLSIKLPQSDGLSGENIFLDKGVFQMFVIFGTKNLRFFEIYDVSARTIGEGVDSVWTFFGQGGKGGH